jgi:predicted ArsR family transcriptional regulator
MATLPQRILHELHTESPLTAAQVAKRLGTNPQGVTTALIRLYKRGKVVHASKLGPRGGYTYALTPEPRPSLWEAIRQAEATL